MSRLTHRRLLGARIIAAAVVATATAAVSVPSLAGAHGTARAADVPACKASQIVDWLDTTPNATAGTTYFQLQFTNLGSACTMRGYPGVSAVSLSGRQLGSAARRVKGIEIKTVTVRRGGTVKAAVGVADTNVIPRFQCQPVTAVGIRVFAPNASTATVIPFPFGVCSASGAGSLTVRPVTN